MSDDGENADEREATPDGTGGAEGGNGGGTEAGNGEPPADREFDDVGEDFAADRERARSLLADEAVDGLYAGVVRGDELDYVFSHRLDDPERVGMQALSLLAHHVGAIADQAELPPAQVAEDAGRLATRMAGDEVPDAGAGPSGDEGAED